MNPTNTPEKAYSLLAGLGVLALSGKDAAKLLQGQATCDCLKLPPENTALGAFCTAKGRALALFRALKTPDGILLLLSIDRIETVRKHLTRYVLRADVAIHDQTAEWGIYGLFGDASALGLPVPQEGGDAAHDAGRHVVRIPGSRHLLLHPAEQAAQMLAAFDAQGWAEIDAGHWHLQDIRAGLPAVVAATAEEFVPQMLNLDLLGGISFTKGCYTGQEIVARTHYLGTLKRRMYRWVGESGPAPQAGDALQIADGQNAGTVVVSASRPEGGFELLAVMNTALVADAAPRGDEGVKTAAGAALELASLPYSIPMPADPASNP